MARRPDRPQPEVLSRDDLKELGRQLAHLSDDAVRNFYHAAYTRCRMVNDRVPSPRSVQELIQAWKVLWTRR
ncbi:MAG TPA: hypothetical protein VIL63_00305 [Terriglobales bacterium]